MNKYALAALPVAALDRIGLAPKAKHFISYVVEQANWSTKWDGALVSREIERISPGLSRVTTRPGLVANSIVHFFSHYQWAGWGPWLARSNSYVVTFYHGKREDDPDAARQIDKFLELLPRADIIVTSARLIEERLASWGVPREKLVRIPIPIDLKLFKPADPVERTLARRRYRVPEGYVVIGSFQKDGVGWGDGSEPKWIKGPDVLVEVARRVARKRPTFVLLTGPARGYVRRELERLEIPYSHEFMSDYEQLPGAYAAIDVYLNPSREEGGPKGVLESMACGVPIVSTRVGMAPDVISDRRNGYLTEIGDVDALAEAILEIAEKGPLQDAMCAAARNDVASCDAPRVARDHWEKVVRPLALRRGFVLPYGHGE